MVKDATSEVYLLELSSEIARLNRRCADLAEELVTRGERPRVLESELATLQRRHAEAVAQLAALQEHLHKTDQAVAATRRELQERTAELDAARGAIAEQRAAAVTKSDEINSLRKALETTQEAVVQVSSERSTLEGRLADLLQTSAETQRRLEEETSARESARSALAERDEMIGQMGSRLTDLEERSAILTAEIAAASEAKADAERSRDQALERLLAQANDKAALEQELEALRAELSASRDETVHLVAALAAREAELKGAESRAIVIENERGKLCERLSVLEAAVAHGSAREQRLRAEVALAGSLESSLRKQLAAMQAQLDGAREEIEQQAMRLERQATALEDGQGHSAVAGLHPEVDRLAQVLGRTTETLQEEEGAPLAIVDADNATLPHAATSLAQEPPSLATPAQNDSAPPARLQLVANGRARPSDDRVRTAEDDSSESCSLGVAVEGLISAVRGSSEGVVEMIDASHSPTGEALLAVNLLASKMDGVDRAIDAAKWAMNDPRAFVYCAEGDHGFTVGLADVFPHPFDAQACAVRLVKRRGGTRRLLVVSDCTDKLGELRESLNRMRCSTAVVCDGRQALHLLSIIEPDMILVDASLPRGEGIRTLNILRCEQRAANVPLGVMWGHPVNMAEYRKHARYVIRELPLTDQALRQALTSVRTEFEAGNERTESAQESKAHV